MKYILFTLFIMLLFQNSSFSQIIEHNHSNNKVTESEIIAAKLKSVQLIFDVDSIAGFNELAAQQQASSTGAPRWEQIIRIAHMKRNYINTKFNLVNTQGLLNKDPIVQAACSNVDFEAGNTSSWLIQEGMNTNSLTQAGCCPTATTRFAVVGPGGDPIIPALNRVPAGGGNFALRIGDPGVAGGYAVKTSQTFSVTAANSLFIYKYLVILEDAGHQCFEQPFFNITFTDATGNPIPCGNYNVTPVSADCTTGGDPNFVSANGTDGLPYFYKPWTTRAFDLSSLIGTNVTVSFIASDCTQGAHAGWGYVDCSCQPLTLSLNGVNIPVGQTNIIKCNAIGSEKLCANSGFNTYTWTGPGVTGQTTQCINVTQAGSYSVALTVVAGTGNCAKPKLFANFIVAPKPIADFNYTPPPSCQLPIVVTFTNMSTLNGGPPITNWYWDFDNNGTVDNTTSSPTYTFNAAGSYSVKLKVSNGGCFDSITKVITITPGSAKADFVAYSGCLNTPSTFTSTGTPLVGLTSQLWYWGDGTPNGSGLTMVHNYAAPGTYSVSHVVSVGGTCRDSITKVITVSPIPIVSFTSNTVCLGAPTNFTNTSSVIAPDNIISWAWDFDNNGTYDNYTQNPSYTFLTAGTFSVQLKVSTNNACYGNITLPVTVIDLPVANFTTIDACMNTNVTLNNTSTPVNLPYDWYFGAGATPVTSNSYAPTSLIYTTSGVKTITLTINANTTCSASITQTVTIFPGPVANFSVPSVCQSTASVYTDLSTPTGSISAWQWDFTDDGVIDDQTATPTHVFPTAGTYTTSLIVKSSNGCLDTIKLPLDVWGHAIPDFIANPVCFNTATTFTNTTDLTTNTNIGTTPTYTWDFADGTGTIILAGNPTHNYLLGGNVNATYNVTLTVSTSHNCVDSITKTINVYANPTASFTSDSVCLGSPSHMLDASNGNGNTVNGFIWDFLSNGTIDATISNPDFTFPSVGSNVVSYTVTSSPVAGLTCSNVTTTITVWINPIPVPNFTFVNKCVNAQPNTFDATSSSISVGTTISYTWAFGDGGTSPTNIAPTHTYAAAGLYTTTLTVTSDKGCKATIAKQVEVYQKPLMSFVNSPACDKSAITFTAVSLPNSGTVTTWNWDFNNTITTFEGTGANSSFTFPTAGSHTVALVTVTSNGCVDTIFKPIYVNDIPVPLFTVDDPDGCPVHCVTFSDSSTPLTGIDKITQWKWSLGDGSSDVINTTNANVKHCYTNTSHNQLALFDIKLTVTTIAGCTNSINKQSFITVFPTPIAKYDVTPNPGSVIDPTEYFNNQSSDYVKWWWTFGDGPINSDSTNKNPKHIYPEINAIMIYNTKLLVMNQYGCIAQAEEPVQIDPIWTFYIPNCFTPTNEDGKNDFFTGFGIGIDYFEMWIFDRWGANIFYTNDMTKGWNGKVHNYSEEGKQDVYTWKVKIKDIFSKNHSYVGHVTLLK